MEMIFSKLFGTQKEPAIEAKTPSPEFVDIKAPDSIKLSVHFDDDYESVKDTESDKSHSKNQKRLSRSFSHTVDMQMLMDYKSKNVEYVKKASDTKNVYLGTLTERDIVEWQSRWDELLTEHPYFPFNIAGTISRFVKQKLVTEKDIKGGLFEVNRAGLPQLLRWMCTCIRPIDNISFLNGLDKNIFFRSYKDFVLTERNHRNFFESIKTFNRDFTFLLDLLMDYLQEGQSHPPMNTKERFGILWGYLKKIPCDNGHAVWIDMEGEKKF